MAIHVWAGLSNSSRRPATHHSAAFIQFTGAAWDALHREGHWQILCAMAR